MAYNGWFGVADGAANGGFYRMSNVKNDTATWTSPATTSITWVTRTGPDQGKASVTIDGKNKGTFDLYASAQAPRNEIFSGLANKAHTVVIKTLLTKNAASSNYNVRLDAFVAGGVTTQESDPKVQYDTWKSTAQALATDGTYRSSATAPGHGHRDLHRHRDRLDHHEGQGVRQGVGHDRRREQGHRGPVSVATAWQSTSATRDCPPAPTPW